MFTGLIQSLGQIEHCDQRQIVIRCPDLRDKLVLGDSVAVNGVCLTVAKIQTSGFVADVSPETLNRSNLGEKDSTPVNLELALAVGDRLGGHFVTGHIDGIGTLRESKMQGGAWEISFEAISSVGRYIVFKGSVTVNGVSLTVADCNDDGTSFSVAVIPHTYQNTNLSYLKSGGKVNLESDVLGKYVEKFLRLDRQENHQSNGHTKEKEITADFLTEHGWHS
jgi:riboflavin synthase